MQQLCMQAAITGRTKDFSIDFKSGSFLWLSTCRIFEYNNI